MQSYQEKAYTDEEIYAILHPYMRYWFAEKFGTFSAPQKLGVIPIHNRENTLIFAPTGTGKTLTAFTSILNELVHLADREELKDQVYCIYISPLKALSRDINVNLLEPLSGIKTRASDDGKKYDIRVGVRTGDTTSSKKSGMLKKPPHILITTPESFAIVLTSPKFREFLKNVSWVIVDEIHSLAESKRGVHLSLSLERLNQFADFTRVGLSATVSPLEEVARFLVGMKDPDSGAERDCRIIDAQFIKNMDIKVLSPVENLIRTPHNIVHNSMYKIIDDLIQTHKTTLIFTNTRSATERIVNTLKDKFPNHYTEKLGEGTAKSLIGAHHGSLSAAHRIRIEDQLKNGELRCIVSSTSLELGIDIGYIDLVILLGSPKSVARALQRIGRSGHKLHETAKGRIIVLDRDDLVECSVLLKSAIEKKIDNVSVPENCLDVLAQQVFGMSIERVQSSEEIYGTVRKSYCYRNLKRQDFNEVISYLSGEYASLEERSVYAKIWHDKDTGMIGKRGKLARVLYMTNIGTIPDETHVIVKIGDEIIGKIDEDFLERLKKGDVFVLGGETYEFQYAKGMTAQVRTSAGRPPTVPSWFSEMLPLSFELALEIQKFRRLMEQYISANRSKEDIISFINSYLYVDAYGANSIYEYFNEQYRFAEIPHEKKIIIEHFKEEGRKYAVFHTLFGRRVNDVLSRAVAFAIAKLQHRDVEITINDNGFLLSYSGNLQVNKAFSVIRQGDLSRLMENVLENTEIMKRRFRHCAGRALMILRNYLGRQKSVGRQQVNSMLLLNAVKRISNDFPILKETRREILHDLMDIDNAKRVLKMIESKDISVKEVFTDFPSPFSFNLIIQGYTDIFKIEDRMDFLRRMHERVISRIERPGKNEEKKFSYLELWEESQEEKRQRKIAEAEEIKSLAAQADISLLAKEEIIHMVDGSEESNREAIEELNSRMDYIETWPDPLKSFVKKRLKDLDERTILLRELNKAYSKIGFDEDILYDLKRLINGERKNFSDKFIRWLNDLLSGVIPFAWDKEIVRFLSDARKEIETISA